MNREKLGKQPRYFENREAPGNKVGEKQRRDFEAWLGHKEEGGCLARKLQATTTTTTFILYCMRVKKYIE